MKSRTSAAGRVAIGAREGQQGLHLRTEDVVELRVVEDGSDRGRDPGDGDSFGERVRGRDGVRSTSRDAEHCETIEPEVVGDLFDVGRPVEERATRERIRQAEAGPFEGEQANTGGVERVGSQGVEATAGKAVEVEEGDPVGDTVFGVADATTVVARDRALVHTRSSSNILIALPRSTL